ncbi:MAG: tail fiber domain-containing protein [Verrucomicrobiales bacterium]|nr:tail fiber domain-containing protein [Verrucomicrobiales bacterium]
MSASVIAALWLKQASCFSQGTAFTYQGRLTAGNNPASGLYDFQFSVFDTAAGGTLIGGPYTNVAVPVTNGLFTAILDFGAAVFTGEPRWLEIAVRTNGSGGFTTLTPRQQITAAPYAIMAAGLSGTVSAAQLTGTLPSSVLAGTYGNAVGFINPANYFAGNGAGLANLNAAQLASGTVPDARIASNIARTNQVWLLGGNPGTVPGTHFVGTTDMQPLELRVNRLRALRIEDPGDSADAGTVPDGAPNVVGGAPVNFVGMGVVGAVIAGGGATNYAGRAYTNSIRGDFCVIGGGLDNTVAAGALAATISGGAVNYIGTNTDYATICGGLWNFIGADAICGAIAGGYGNVIDFGTVDCAVAGGTSNTIAPDVWGAFIGGGVANYLDEGADYSVIAGGDYNYVGAEAHHSVIGGGGDNTIPTGAAYAVVPGGQANYATNFAFAAGRRAKARHTGAFVWADSHNLDVSSSAPNQFTARASGGVRFFSNSNMTVGVMLAPGSGAWTSISDRNAKENFAPVDPVEVLHKLRELPIQTWNYKGQDPAVRHIGPTAQDFHAAFGLGDSDTGITTIDADGVALAAIQGLNKKLEQKDAEIAELKRELAELKRLVQQLVK